MATHKQNYKRPHLSTHCAFATFWIIERWRLGANDDIVDPLPHSQALLHSRKRN